MSDGHTPVLLAEVLETLSPRDGAFYVDGTFGGGGYARAILEAADCKVLGIDRDPDAIARGRVLVEQFRGRLVLAQGRFSELEAILSREGETGTDGVVLDLGVSSFQLDEAARGFSFRNDGPLDMRMGRDGPTAADILNTAEEKEIAGLIFSLGEERQSRRIAHAIVQARPLSRTSELADIVAKALGPAAARHPIHPATRTFQALRLAVNDELGELKQGLEAAERGLRPHGRLVVVAFHSLEDRIVKQFLVERSGALPGASRHAPEQRRLRPPSFRLITSRPRMPSESEVARNTRSRSARLRAAERIEVSVAA
jgi:16S rRNA (cytosine1402-N4)-methyltransferase